MHRKEIDKKISILSAELEAKLSEFQFSNFELFATNDELDLAIYCLLEYLTDDEILISRRAFDILHEFCLYCGGYFRTQEQFLKMLQLVQHD